ncbi:MAG: glycoside hydrolase family 20 zincin-like fold domain-containing protein, partial [Phycisphaerales bacterium]|nr:glycoside hydrolase family 20 zincin-like fold domain-containing protein [Phycisphaerales bacterium]
MAEYAASAQHHPVPSSPASPQPGGLSLRPRLTTIPFAIDYLLRKGLAPILPERSLSHAIQHAERSSLLPLPRDFRIHPGVCRLGRRVTVEVRPDDARLRRAVEPWLSRVAANGKSPTNESDLCLTIAVDASSIVQPDGYRLSVRERQITLVGTTSAACFHGLQTLFQCGCHDRDAIPCCEIVDWPDFRTRGLLHDVTRGKVPTLATLKSLADRLASLKINQLQLYIEHAFSFAFDPDIAGPNDALTPDEIRELDAYCRERFINLVPAVATLGHMGRILSMPRYRHLAEIEPACEWADLGWPERAR